MSDKFRDKYRIASARLQSWDYGSNASYFITICTKKMIRHFGQIIKGKMYVNNVGSIAEKFWSKIPEHFPFILLHAFVVMPNHIHGILIINKMGQSISVKGTAETPKLGVCTKANREIENRGNVNQQANDVLKSISDKDDVETPISNKDDVKTPKLGVSTQNPPEKAGKTTGGKNPKWKPDTLGVILNQYKRICTIKIRELHPDFDWHERYYDHIIRDEKDYLRIKNYVLNNPKNWEKDKFFNE